MSTVKAKFKCDHIDDRPEYQQKEVTLSPVISGSEENKSFAKYTPAGLLQLSISYETKASDFFEPGESYYLDIIKAAD